MENKKKLNILIFSWRGPNHPNAGGAEQSTFAHAKGWVKAGHKVSLFTSYYIGAKREEEIEGVNIIRSGAQFLGVQAEAFKWYLFGAHGKFDLVVDEFHGIPFFTPLYVRTKKLAFIHEVTKEVWRLNPWPLPFKLVPAILGILFEPLIFKIFYKQVCCLHNKNIPFMTVSKSTKKDLTDWGINGKNITVIHNGVNLPKKINLSAKEPKKTIIFLGVLSKDKGIEDAVKVFKYLYEKDQGFQFWVVGKSAKDYLIKIRQLATQLGVGNIKFWGYVSEELKFELLAKSHILINPSIREGWGLTVIEAAAMGTPTVGYNVAGLRDSVSDRITGLLVPPKNIEALALNIIELISDKARLQKMSDDAILWSKKFRWEEACKKSLKLIENLGHN